MESDDERLEALKARMSQNQRQEMAEIIRKEMERRGMIEGTPKKTQVKSSTISGGLSADDVKELYGDVGQAIQQLRTKKLEQKLQQAKKDARAAKTIPSSRPQLKLPSVRLPQIALPRISSGERATGEGSFGKMALMYGIVGFGALKILLSTGVVNASMSQPMPEAVRSQVSAEAPKSIPAEEMDKKDSAIAAAPINMPVITSSNGNWSTTEKEILSQLDARRVELEKRKESLDRREAELRNQTTTLSERLAELRGLSARLAEVRKEKDHEQESRLAQLANVYSAMGPNEAAVLLGKLDDFTSLELLERMPEKRMGQILGFMDKERAVHLTRLLTESRVN